MGLNCVDLLPGAWSSVGLGCDSIPILQEGIELLAEDICSLQCDLSHITTTTDCDLLPADFDTLFPACFTIPDNAVVIQQCSCAMGGVKIWSYDPDISDWVRLGISFKVGAATDFVDPNNPTDAELLALFGGYPQNDVLVNIRPTREFWASSNCGVTWFQINDVPEIGADVQQTGFQSYNQIGRETVPFEFYDENIYTTGSSAAFGIEVDDLLDITVVYGYVIDQYSDAANPTDDGAFRIRLSGAVGDTSWYMGGASGNMNIVNGLNYATFNVKMKATTAANLRLRISFCANGTTPSGPQDWEFTGYCDRTSVSVARA